MGNASMLKGWEQVMLSAMTFSGLWVTAKVFGKEGENTGKPLEHKGGLQSLRRLQPVLDSRVGRAK